MSARVFLVAGLAVLGSACGGDRVQAEDLYGLWVSQGASEVVAFDLQPAIDDPDLALVGPDFWLYRYPEGVEPVVVMRGGWSIGEIAPGDGRPALVQQVVWAEDPSFNGTSFGNLILALGDEVLVLESASSPTGERAYDRVEALP